MKTVVFFKALCVCYVLSKDASNQKQINSEVFNYQTASRGLGSFSTANVKRPGTQKNTREHFQDFQFENQENDQYKQDSALVIQYEDDRNSRNSQDAKYVAVVEDVDEGPFVKNQVEMFVQRPGMVQERNSQMVNFVQFVPQKDQQLNMQHSQQTNILPKIDKSISSADRNANSMEMQKPINLGNTMNVQMFARSPRVLQDFNKNVPQDKYPQIANFKQYVNIPQTDQKPQKTIADYMVSTEDKNKAFSKYQLQNSMNLQKFMNKQNHHSMSSENKEQQYYNNFLGRRQEQAKKPINVRELGLQQLLKSQNMQGMSQGFILQNSGAKFMRSTNNGGFLDTPKIQLVNSAKLPNTNQMGIQNIKSQNLFDDNSTKQIRQQIQTATNNRQKFEFADTYQKQEPPQLDDNRNVYHSFQPVMFNSRQANNNGNSNQFDKSLMLQRLQQVRPVNNVNRYNYEKLPFMQKQYVSNVDSEKFKPNDREPKQFVKGYSSEYQTIHNVNSEVIEKQIPVPYQVQKQVPFYTEKKLPYDVHISHRIPYNVQKKIPDVVKDIIKVPSHTTQPNEAFKNVPYAVKVFDPRPYEVEKPVPYPIKVYVPTPYTVENKLPYPIKYDIPIPQPYNVGRKETYAVRIPVEKTYTADIPEPYIFNSKTYVPYTISMQTKVPVDRHYPVEVSRNLPYKFIVSGPAPYSIERSFPDKIEKYVSYNVEAPAEKPIQIQTSLFPVAKNIPNSLHVTFENEPILSYSDWKPRD